MYIICFNLQKVEKPDEFFWPIEQNEEKKVKIIIENLDKEAAAKLTMTESQWQSLENKEPKYKGSTRILDLEKSARTLISSYKQGYRMYS